jgi:alpha-L-glutamate ligase-like protein
MALSFGILGVNSRNLKYLSRKNRALLDSKLSTKKVLQKAGLPVLKTLGIIQSEAELEKFDFESLPSSFVLKPDRGYGGSGILVLFSKKEGPVWIKADGKRVDAEDLKEHILEILEGRFSLKFLPDIAFFEERAKLVKELKPYTKRGIPDIRVIVYQNIPVMAMLRLPTMMSQGRANLHQGAIGVGIDLASGKTTHAIWLGKSVKYLPGTKYSLEGIQIPFFKDILKLAILAQKALKVKFAGIDIAIDREKGPVIFEANLRPGLSIQLANMAPLEKRLKMVKDLKVSSETKGVKVAEELFGKENSEERAPKKILGIVEPVEIIFNANGKEQKIKVLAKIDTGAWRSAISLELAQRINLSPEKMIGVRIFRSSLGEEIRGIFPLTFILGGEKIESEVSVAKREKMQYEMIIGQRDLKNFLIDPSLIKKW